MIPSASGRVLVGEKTTVHQVHREFSCGSSMSGFFFGAAVFFFGVLRAALPSECHVDTPCVCLPSLTVSPVKR
jgi:hypothetical protein